MIKTLQRPTTLVRHMQLAILLLLAAPIFHPAWAEAENLGGETAKRLNDIPYIACFIRSAERYQVDVELAIAVAIVESSLNPDAVSSSDAVGLMQIKWPLTAEHLGITQRELLFDPCINIDAGVAYLKELIDQNAEVENSDPLVQALGNYRLGPTTIANTVPFPQRAVDYAEAVLKQRDILSESDAPSEQSTAQIAEQSAERSTEAEADVQRTLAEETPPLREVVENTAELSALNDLQENQVNEPSSTNISSSQAQDLTDTGQQQQSDDQIQAKPMNSCSTAGVRSLLLSNHNPAERGQKFRGWLEKTGVNCTELQLLKLRNSLPLWLGTALNSELLGAVEGLMEEKRLQR